MPPDAFDELWNIEERWESQKWFKHHLRVLEDIDQESKAALNEDDLFRILQFNEKLDNEESFRFKCSSSSLPATTYYQNSIKTKNQHQKKKSETYRHFYITFLMLLIWIGIKTDI